MLSSEDLETLIASKKREIEREKTVLGLSPATSDYSAQDNKENDRTDKQQKQVNFKECNGQPAESDEQVYFKGRRILCEQDQNEKSEDKKESNITDSYEPEIIPPDLERYIRRYIGIPAMLKAGEYSPNNPLLRAERAAGGGDALLALGEYERRRHTLRKVRQAQYRQYLDQQAKKKQEAKEQAESERREREEKERQREEREKQLLLERDRYTPERRRASVSSVPISSALVQTTKVDTGVQVAGVSSALSVAVQTDDVGMYRMPPSPPVCLTRAERELSPRTAAEPGGRRRWGASQRLTSHEDFDEQTSTIKKTNRDKLVSDLRHTYMPSIFDADAIQMRNLQAEKEAAARRQFYQQELKNQILEQQRIREERNNREKMLEQAEMRRLEEQLRMLRVAQEREIDKQHDISAAMKHNAKDYETKRTELQREIDLEQQKMLRATSQPNRNLPKRYTNTSKSDTPRSKLPFYYPHNEKTYQPLEKDKKPYSFNIPDNSVFSTNYDVDSYLRKNLSYRDKMNLDIENKNIDFRDKIDFDIENIGNNNKSAENKQHKGTERNIVVEKALIHEPKENKRPKSQIHDMDNISIPVLRHSPKSQQISKENSTLSDAMRKIDDKWKVPAVQKNILKSLPNEDGKNISILTQLGSIRRQLQLEQLKLDKMLSENDS